MNRERVVGFLLFLLPLSLGGCQPPESKQEDRPWGPRSAVPPPGAQAPRTLDGATSGAGRTTPLEPAAGTGGVDGALASIAVTDSEPKPARAPSTKQAEPAADGSKVEPKGGGGAEAKAAAVLVAASAEPISPGISGDENREAGAGTKPDQKSPSQGGNPGRGEAADDNPPAPLPQPPGETSPISGSFDAAEFSRSGSATPVPTATAPAVGVNRGPARLPSDAPPQEEGEGAVPAVQPPPLNSLLLEVLKTMPQGGGYSVSGTAASNLASSIAVDARTGNLRIEAEKAQPSYCSGATYVAFLAVLSELQVNHRIDISPEAADALLMKRQADGVGVWGRWNSNGPGTAKLFADLGIGTNFTDIAMAMPGDFMKIWWNDGIGSTERGHSVVFLGAGRNDSGEEWVKFWSSNQDVGYSEKIIPRSKIVRVLFSRLEDPSRINLVTSLPAKDEYLSTLLKRPSSESEMFALCRVDAAPNSSLLKGAPAFGDANLGNPGAPPAESNDQKLARAFGQLFSGTRYVEFPVEAQVELLRRVQRSLAASGDYPDEPDGLPGPMTRRAISAWQERLRLKASGALDEASLNAMGLGELSESELRPGDVDKPAKALGPIEPTAGGRQG